jgi:hypothetical protein
VQSGGNLLTFRIKTLRLPMEEYIMRSNEGNGLTDDWKRLLNPTWQVLIIFILFNDIV